MANPEGWDVESLKKELRKLGEFWRTRTTKEKVLLVGTVVASCLSVAALMTRQEQERRPGSSPGRARHLDDADDFESHITRVTEEYGSVRAALEDGAISMEDAINANVDLPDPIDLSDDESVIAYWERNG